MNNNDSFLLNNNDSFLLYNNDSDINNNDNDTTTLLTTPLPTSTSFDHIKRIEKISYQAAIAFIATFGMIGNSLTLFIYIRTKYRKPYFFIIHLGILELIQSLVYMETFISSVFVSNCALRPCVKCTAEGFVTGFTSIGSVVMVVFISAERCVAAKIPFLHRQGTYLTKWLVVIGGYVYTAGITCPPLLGWSSYGRFGRGWFCSFRWADDTDAGRHYVVFLLILGFAIPFILIVTAYVLIFRIVRMTRKAKRPLASDKTIRRNEQRQSQFLDLSAFSSINNNCTANTLGSNTLRGTTAGVSDSLGFPLISSCQKKDGAGSDDDGKLTEKTAGGPGVFIKGPRARLSNASVDGGGGGGGGGLPPCCSSTKTSISSLAMTTPLSPQQQLLSDTNDPPRTNLNTNSSTLLSHSLTFFKRPSQEVEEGAGASGIGGPGGSRTSGKRVHSYGGYERRPSSAVAFGGSGSIIPSAASTAAGKTSAVHRSVGIRKSSSFHGVTNWQSYGIPRIVLLLVVVFLFSWIPYTTMAVYTFLNRRSPTVQAAFKETDNRSGTPLLLLEICSLLAKLWVIYNPLIYGFYDKHFRAELRDLWLVRKVFRTSQPSFRKQLSRREITNLIREAQPERQASINRRRFYITHAMKKPDRRGTGGLGATTALPLTSRSTTLPFTPSASFRQSLISSSSPQPSAAAVPEWEHDDRDDSLRPPPTAVRAGGSLDCGGDSDGGEECSGGHFLRRNRQQEQQHRINSHKQVGSTRSRSLDIEIPIILYNHYNPPPTLPPQPTPAVPLLVRANAVDVILMMNEEDEKEQEQGDEPFDHQTENVEIDDYLVTDDCPAKTVTDDCLVNSSSCVTVQKSSASVNLLGVCCHRRRRGHQAPSSSPLVEEESSAVTVPLDLINSDCSRLSPSSSSFKTAAAETPTTEKLARTLQQNGRF